MRKLLTVVCLFLGLSWASAQSVISGVVFSSEDGQPVLGMVVKVTGTTVSALTDVEGHFQIKVPSTSSRLLFSFIGMIPQELEAKQGMKVLMQANLKEMSEVVVIGYGTQSAKMVTSAISSIRGSSMKDASHISFDEALQGRTTGLQVTVPSGVVGQPPIIRIRGVNSITSGSFPLYIVDGVPVQSENIGMIGDANGLSDINPNDIESIDVLKDAAAAAMYGSRAANGVVLITTKSGSQNKAKVSYDAWVGVTSPTKKFEVMNAKQYVTYKNNAVKNFFGMDNINLSTYEVLTDGRKAFNLMYNADGSVVDSDWSSAVFQNGFTHNQTVSVSGGSDRTQYFLSGNYVNQEGMVKGDAYKRLGIKANLNTKVTDYLKIGTHVNAANSSTETVDAGRSGSSFSAGGFSRLALINAPNLPIYNPDGSPFYSVNGGLGYGANTVSSQYLNPAALISIHNKNATGVDHSTVNFYAELTPANNLIFRTQYGVDYSKVEDNQFWSPLHGDGFYLNGSAENVASSNKQWVWSNTIQYQLQKDNNNFNFLIGTEANQSDFSSWGISKSNLSDIKYTTGQGPFLTVESSGDYLESNSLLSYFGRVNYDYMAKYMVSLNFRRDGYSGLGHQKWGNFGGVSAAWRISDELFFQSMKEYVNDLKIRGSFGVVGNTRIGSYAAQSFYKSYYYGGSPVYQLDQIGDENLKWETSKKYDVGFSGVVFQHLNVDFDYYFTTTNDLILEVPQSPSKGIPGGVISTNIGAMKNSGIELSVGADVIRTKDFTWNTNFNFSTNKNEVTALADGLKEILGGDIRNVEITNTTVVGKSIGQLYLCPTRGIDRETGRRIFITPTGEEVLFTMENGDFNWYKRDGTAYTGGFETVMAGNTLPTFFGGWTNNFRYKNVDLSIFLQFSGGNKIYNGTKGTAADNRYWNNTLDVYNNSWSENHKNATYAKPVYGDRFSNGNGIPITDLVEDGGYLRLKNIALGYTFNTQNWNKSVGISKLRFYLQAQNLFVLTHYTGLDPEVLSNVTNYNLAGGTDRNTMPQAKVLTAGVNISF